MKPRVLAAFLVVAAIGAGAEAASLPRPFSPVERQRVAVVRKLQSRHLPEPVRWSNRDRYRHLGPTHMGRRKY